MDKANLNSTLRSAKATIEFEKLDGSLRRIYCTLQESFLPTKEFGTGKRKVNDDILVVWDLEKNAWRSFRIASIKSITVEP